MTNGLNIPYGKVKSKKLFSHSQLSGNTYVSTDRDLDNVRIILKPWVIYPNNLHDFEALADRNNHLQILIDSYEIILKEVRDKVDSAVDCITLESSIPMSRWEKNCISTIFLCSDTFNAYIQRCDDENSVIKIEAATDTGFALLLLYIELTIEDLKSYKL